MAEAQPRPVAIGIDIGGTKIAFGVVGADGRLRERVRVDAFEAAGPEVLLGRVGDVTRRLAEDLPAEGLAGVGVGTRELVGVDGEIHSASTLPWKRADLASAVAPLELAALEADVRAGALAEARVGAGQVYENFVYLTVGTGISSCVVRDGIPDPGTRGFAQLIGNAVVTIPSSLDGPLVSAELETVAGGPGLVARYNACTGGGLTRGEDVFRRAAEGDGAAVAVIEELAGMVGSILALLVNVHDPQAVVVGGGLGSVGGRYWSTLVRRARECIWAAEARELPILPASLGEDAGVVGAGLLALDASVSHVASP